MRHCAEKGELPPLYSTSRRLLEMLSDVAQVRPTVLEIGCGSGALMVELLERGAATADGVDLSPQSVATAERRAESAGVTERATFTVGDGSRVELAQHDWVILDRVICCYAHLDQLLTNALGAARSRFVMTMPLSYGWRSVITKPLVRLERAFNRFIGRPCPAFVHAIRQIEERLSRSGFRRLHEQRVGMWHAAVWERASTG